MNHYIIRYGEIALKGKNRGHFENKLVSNIAVYVRLRYGAESSITKIRGRLILAIEADVDLRPIFGLVSYSKAIKVEKDIGVIKQRALEEFAKISSSATFRVETHRLDKSFPLKSPEISRDVGEVIFEKYKTEVDFKNPAVVLGVEIHNKTAFIYTKTVRCFGGLPLGSSEKILVPLGNNRSLLTALNLMRRGCLITFIGDKKELPLIKLFNSYKDPIIIKEYKTLNEKIKAYASPNEISNLDKDEDFLMLHPIVLLSDKEVEEDLKKYEEMQK